LILRGIFGPKRDRLLANLHNEDLHNLYFSPDIIKIINPRRITLVRHVARKSEMRNAYRALVGIPERNIPLGRPKHR
jgi:hypothetical protein